MAKAERRNVWKQIGATLQTAWRYDRMAVLSVVVLSVLDAVTPYVAILLSAYILDGLAAGRTLGELLLAACAGIGLTLLLQLARAFFQQQQTVHMEVCVHRFDAQRSRRTLAMDYQDLDSPAVNDIRNRIERDQNWGAGFYSVFMQLHWLLGSLFGLLAAVVVLVPLFLTQQLQSNVPQLLFLAGLLAVTIGASLFQTKYVLRRQYEKMDQWQHFLAYSAYYLFDRCDYKLGKDVRIFHGLPLLEHHLNKVDKLRERQIMEFTALQAQGGLVGGLTAGLLQGGAYLFVVLRALGGGLTVGAVVKYATTLYQLTSRFADLTSAFGEFAVTAGRQQSTLAYIHVPDSLYKGTLPVEKRADNEYELAFHDVSFKYPGSERYALRHLSMQLRVGERLAVVGQNGSGKTTMIKLLCRLYDPTEGVITLNGIDIRKYDYAEYQSIFSVVFQDFRLFSFPLAQNVAASADFDTERVLDSLEKAGFAERLAAMPQGLETPLYRDYSEDGVEISGGEAQKLALARALYKDAPFIVLDEPTAALDPVAEYEIYAAFDRIVGDKTTVYISHRLASCRFCDDIAVFDEGMLVQRGNHAALLEQEGKYRALWNAQAQYYTEQGTESPRTDRSATPAV